MTVRRVPMDLKQCIVNIIIWLFLVTTVKGQSEGYCKNGSKCVPLKECPGLYAARMEDPTNKAIQDLISTLSCQQTNQRQVILCCPDIYKTMRFSEENLDKTSLLPNNSICGVQNNDRIVGGVVTEVDEHPWMALLRYYKPKGNGFYCGGVLISSRYVLTAAHCVKGVELPPTWNLTEVRLGEYNLKSNPDCVGDDCTLPVVDVPIEEIIAHASYRPSNKSQQFDIALIRLKYEVQFTDFVKPICLPYTTVMKSNSYEGYTMEAAGWGKTEKKSSSEVKLKVRLPIVKQKECQIIYANAGRDITEKQMCAGGIDGRDSCRGDSGGPLMGQSSSNTGWYVLGVVSYGPSPCGTEGWPGVYTRVTYFVDWILDNIKP